MKEQPQMFPSHFLINLEKTPLRKLTKLLFLMERMVVKLFLHIKQSKTQGQL
jgi:hypothetical protein